MPKPEKINRISEIKEKFQTANSILLTDFTGLTVEEISELRNRLRASSVEYKVVKNTLAKISIEELGVSQVLNYLDGPTAIAFGLDDPLASAKIILEFSKKSNKPTIKTLYVDGQLFDANEIEELAKLPHKDVLIAQLLGTMSVPMSRLVFSLQNLLQKTVFVLNAIKEKKEHEG